ncbi:hypothetical protein WJX64_04910 [Leifsonia sp. YIM 134122]|uniref:Uncharacterized protein n=1 Tax=Leifsonia stereocauli TaxID=3134136 RepID=A0ABU9W1K2_9MICO
MLLIRIKIDGREYTIPSELDAQAIMESITGQLRAGGGFVEIVRTPDRSVNVLVSPGMSLTVETTVIDEYVSIPGERDDSWPAQAWIDPLDTF